MVKIEDLDFADKIAKVETSSNVSESEKKAKPHTVADWDKFIR